MKQSLKKVWRMASLVEQQLSSLGSETNTRLPEVAWLNCLRLVRMRQQAQQRGWFHVATKVERELTTEVFQLTRQLVALQKELESAIAEKPLPAVHTIYEDLLALDEEFGEYSIDLKNKTISVVTEPIVLEGVSLGAFEIRLELADQNSDSPFHYQVFAQDPQPPITDDAVTHPHVQSDNVCEGDARVPIRRALEQGRLLDFFMLVSRLLRTYNPDSPYVALSDWHSAECSECADVVTTEEQTHCSNCENRLCRQCANGCADCSSSLCHDCSTRCEICRDDCCESCLKECGLCGSSCCSNCLDNEERCPICETQEDEETYEPDQDITSPETVTPAGTPL
ncbi:hypothetical protein [Gimesia chilikensis]|uniref:RING-type domain-containing protein n=1 Tax=Gimesia chilikensis TaxID=2605989 RepID=A0A517PVU8_9PLAN|nr:hypothetical protein [Gimesia chilikensis]QDT23500.1 hypothetical protein HG66A1_53210 [Gimesia chilikensis]